MFIYLAKQETGPRGGEGVTTYMVNSSPVSSWMGLGEKLVSSLAIEKLLVRPDCIV